MGSQMQAPEQRPAAAAPDVAGDEYRAVSRPASAPLQRMAAGLGGSLRVAGLRGLSERLNAAAAGRTGATVVQRMVQPSALRSDTWVSTEAGKTFPQDPAKLPGTAAKDAIKADWEALCTRLKIFPASEDPQAQEQDTEQDLRRGKGYKTKKKRRREKKTASSGFIKEVEAYNKKCQEVKEKSIVLSHNKKDLSNDEFSAWFETKPSAKQMEPSFKLPRLTAGLTVAELPEDVQSMHKSFFQHTTDFVSTDNQGRNKEYKAEFHESYFRSKQNWIRHEFRGYIKQDKINTLCNNGALTLMEKPPSSDDEQGEEQKNQVSKTKTIDIVNKELFNNLYHESAYFDVYKLNKYPDILLVSYVGGQGVGFGPAGAVSNTVTLQQVWAYFEKCLAEPAQTGAEPVPSQQGQAPAQVSGDSEISRVYSTYKDLLGDSTYKDLHGAQNKNIHDKLTGDRGGVVGKLSVIAESYKMKAIQEPGHPSLIIQNSRGRAFPVASFVNKFNKASEKLSVPVGVGVQTRMTARSSFGFLWPTASSIGKKAVRIWPGYAPAELLCELLSEALKPKGADAQKRKKRPSESGNDGGDDDGRDHLKRQKTSTADAVFPPVRTPDPAYVTVLRAAVHYAVLALNHAAQDPANATAATMNATAATNEYRGRLLVRLSRNLSKANHLLGMTYTATATAYPDIPKVRFEEQRYLKSMLVVDNLMEYSNLLIAATKPLAAPQADIYPAYVNATLFDQDAQVKPDTKVFYFDSGMQALAAATLLASKATQVNTAPPSVYNVDSYFEYPNMLGKLKSQGIADEYAPPVMMEVDADDVDDTETPPKTFPDVFSFDLNPVRTESVENRPAAKKNAINILSRYASGSKKQIPIFDVTNATLGDVKEVIGAVGVVGKYPSYIVAESMTKYYQLGADKYTLGRLIVVGDDGFLGLADTVLGPISKGAANPLIDIFRRNMDRVFYGGAVPPGPAGAVPFAPQQAPTEVDADDDDDDAAMTPAFASGDAGNAQVD